MEGKMQSTAITDKTSALLLGANGELTLHLGWMFGKIDFTVTGGPFDAFRPKVNGDFGVCVRAERVPRTADVVVAIKDFDVPRPEQLRDVHYALKETIEQALSGQRVWIGCMGGWGRTGLFMAILAKVCGEHDPIAYVREHYTSHAVETKPQQNYVDEFDVETLRDWLFWAGWTERFRRLLHLR
jgi:hypothetical protein